MTIGNFFSGLDTTTLTISFGFFGIYYGIHFSLFEAVGDIKMIRDNVIHSLAIKQSELNIISFIDGIYEESKVLLLPPIRKSFVLKIVLCIFAFISLITIAHTPLTNVISFIPSKDIILYIYSASLPISIVFLFYEVKFFREFRRLEKKYPISHALAINNSLTYIKKI